MRLKTYNLYFKVIYYTIKRIAIISYIYAISLIGHASASEKIIIAGDYFCPYNCTPNMHNPGYIIELLQELFKPHDIDIDYVILPWQEAIKAVKNGNINCMISLTDNIDDFILTPQPVAQLTTGLYTTNDTAWVLDGIDSLTNKKICTIHRHNTLRDIKQYIIDNYASCPSNFMLENEHLASINCLHNLIDGNIDIVVESDDVINFLSCGFDTKADVTKIHRIDDAGSINIYIAFSPMVDKSQEHADIVIKAIKAPSNQEKIRQLAKKYGL